MNKALYLTQQAANQRRRAGDYRRVATAIQTHHKQFTKRTLVDVDDLAYISRSGYKPTLVVRYQTTDATGRVSHHVDDYWLTEGPDDTPVTPGVIQATLLTRATNMEAYAKELEIEAGYIDDLARTIGHALDTYNKLVDSLTPAGRELLDVHHVYNHSVLEGLKR